MMNKAQNICTKFFSLPLIMQYLLTLIKLIVLFFKIQTNRQIHIYFIFYKVHVHVFV